MDKTNSWICSTRSLALSGFVALVVAMGIGRFAFTPQLPFMEVIGLSFSDGGWLAGANYFGYLLGAVLAGRKGVSAVVLTRLGLWVVVISTAAMALSGPFEWWFLMRFIAGVGSAWVLVGTATEVLARLATLGASSFERFVFAGVGAGIALVGLVCQIGSQFGMGASMLWLALAGLALVCTLMSVALGGKCESFCSKALVSTLPTRTSQYPYVLVLCYGLFGFGYILPATYLPALARSLLDNVALFGWVWPLFGFAAVVSTLSLAFLSRWPRTYIWASAQIVMAFGIAMMIIIPSISGLVVAAVCVGGTFMLITLLGLQEARQQAEASVQKLLSDMTAAFAAGQFVGPVLTNALLEMGGSFNSALWLGVVALLASSVLLVYFMCQSCFIQERH